MFENLLHPKEIEFAKQLRKKKTEINILVNIQFTGHI